MRNILKITAAVGTICLLFYSFSLLALDAKAKQQAENHGQQAPIASENIDILVYGSPFEKLEQGRYENGSWIIDQGIKLTEALEEGLLSLPRLEETID